MDYIELHAASAFSFLEGAALPEDFVERCVELGAPAMALLDRDGVYGAARFHMAAQKAGIRAHIGAELSLADGHRLPVLVESRTGYQNLCRLITRIKLRAGKKGEGAVTDQDLEEFSTGLIALANLDTAKKAVRLLGRGNVYAEVQRHFSRQEEARNHAMIQMAGTLGLPVIATNGARYARPQQRELLDVFTCIHHHRRLEDAGRLLEANSERHLKSASEMTRLFADLPDAIAHTLELSERLGFTLNDLGYQFPRYPVPTGETMTSFPPPAHRRRRAPAIPAVSRARPPPDRARARADREAGSGRIFPDRVGHRAFLPRARNSGARTRFGGQQRSLLRAGHHRGRSRRHGFAVRALSLRRARRMAGHRSRPAAAATSASASFNTSTSAMESCGAAMTANVITYRGRSAAREIGKALGFEPKPSTGWPRWSHAWEWNDPRRHAGTPVPGSRASISSDPRIRKFFELLWRMQDLPRHLGQHSGGMVICQGAARCRGAR